ncbi:DUF6879 family protein [Actinomadura sp. 3N407]
MAVLHFDEDDVFTVAQLLEDPGTVEQHKAWRRIAWDASVSRDAFLRSL